MLQFRDGLVVMTAFLVSVGKMDTKLLVIRIGVTRPQEATFGMFKLVFLERVKTKTREPSCLGFVLIDWRLDQSTTTET